MKGITVAREEQDEIIEMKWEVEIVEWMKKEE